MPEFKPDLDRWYQPNTSLDNMPTTRASYGLLLNNNAKLHRKCHSDNPPVRKQC